MSNDLLTDYSLNPNSISAFTGVNVSEGMARNLVNNAMRQFASTVRANIAANAGTITSASTLTLASISTGDYIFLTPSGGSSSITSFGTATAGLSKRLEALGTVILRHDTAKLNLPSGADLTISTGDLIYTRALSDTSWKVIHFPNNGIPQSIVNASSITASDTSSVLILSSGTIAKANASAIFTPDREALTSARTYYVRTDGSDSNTGLVNDAAGAWLTLQKAWDVIQDTLDLAGYVVTVQVGDGTYTGPLSAKGRCVGQENQDSIVFQGNSGTPTNVIINATSPSSGATIFAGGGSAFTIKDMRIRSTTAGDGIVANMGSTIYFSGLDFGACAGAHITASQQSFILASGNYTVSGAATRHWQAQFPGSLIFVSGRTVTISGTPAFSTAFATSGELSDISCSGMTFTGSATGTRYSVTLNAVINTGGGGANYLPGDVGGSSATGGQYA